MDVLFAFKRCDLFTESLLPTRSVDHIDQENAPSIGAKLVSLQRSACSTPLSQTNRCTKEQDYRPKVTGRKTPTMASPVPGAPFLRPVHQVPLVPHVPMVRPAHQLPPGLVQRMLAQGVHPQHLPPLLQAGINKIIRSLINNNGSFIITRFERIPNKQPLFSQE